MTKVLGTLMAVILLAGCGAQAPKESAVYRECKSAWGPVITSLTDFNQHIAQGLGIDDYARRAGASFTVLGRAIDSAKAHGGFSDECSGQVAKPLTATRVAYQEAYEIWDDCYTTPSCQTPRGAVLRKIRTHWADAAQDVSQARKGLEQIKDS